MDAALNQYQNRVLHTLREQRRDAQDDGDRIARTGTQDSNSWLLTQCYNKCGYDKYQTDCNWITLELNELDRYLTSQFVDTVAKRFDDDCIVYQRGCNSPHSAGSKMESWLATLTAHSSMGFSIESIIERVTTALLGNDILSSVISQTTMLPPTNAEQAQRQVLEHRIALLITYADPEIIKEKKHRINLDDVDDATFNTGIIKTLSNFCHHGTHLWGASRDFYDECEEKIKTLKKSLTKSRASRSEKIDELQKIENVLGKTYLTPKALSQVTRKIFWADSKSGLDQSLNPYYDLD